MSCTWSPSISCTWSPLDVVRSRLESVISDRAQLTIDLDLLARDFTQLTIDLDLLASVIVLS